MKFTILDSNTRKAVQSENYNYVFSKKTGSFARWGNSLQDDPQFAPFPEILDIEITKSCNGIPNEQGVETPCPFCYKANVPGQNNMSLETFKAILDKFDVNGVSCLTQIALGADSTGTANPDLILMMEYAKSKGVVPNITLANVSENIADKLTPLCGAVAISRYDNKTICYDSVKRLTDRGMNQVNIHQLVSEETYEQVLETLADTKTDSRLSKLNAVVFLSLKQKGRGGKYNPLSFDKFKTLIDFARGNSIPFGMDSCSAHKFLKAIELNSPLESSVEPCEASCFSSYINTYGEFFACSFAEKKGQGVNVLTSKNFQEVWNSTYSQEFRNRLLENNRNCILFNSI